MTMFLSTEVILSGFLCIHIVLKEALHQITKFSALSGRPGIKPPVWVAVPHPLVRGVRLGEDIRALCTLS